MTSRARAHPRLTLAVRARALALLVLAIPVVTRADPRPAMGLLVIGAIWSIVSWIDRRAREPVLPSLAEAVAVGLIIGLTLQDASSLLGAIAVTAFTAGLRSGARAVVYILILELTTILAVHLGRVEVLTSNQASDTLTWSFTGLGLGFIASYLRSEWLRQAADPLTPYRDAQQLIRDLLDLSGDLGSGLDPVTLGTRIAVTVRNELPVGAVAVHVFRGDHLTPLVSGGSSISIDQSELEPMAARAWESGETEVEGTLFAFPLDTEAGRAAVVSGLLPHTAVTGIGLQQRLEGLRSSLTTLAVHLDTAMLFTRLRDTATADERRRLAREMHDGVAQDIASLGYLVDALAAAPASPAQAESLRRLRERITAVVTQVRVSVQTLRTDVQASESLGAALGGVARHLSESSGVPIRVTVNERTARLRPEVEAELLRIAQEAMTNAVRHAQASVIDVSCLVSAPTAEIVIRDDGHGLGTARPDSYGLAIMRERAGLIDADLAIEPAEPHGTVVTVRVPSRHAAASRTETHGPAKVTG